MKLTLVGAGGFRTPVIYRALRHRPGSTSRSEEHTSELQSPVHPLPTRRSSDLVDPRGLAPEAGPGRARPARTSSSHGQCWPLTIVVQIWFNRRHEVDPGRCRRVPNSRDLSSPPAPTRVNFKIGRAHV